MEDKTVCLHCPKCGEVTTSPSSLYNNGHVIQSPTTPGRQQRKCSTPLCLQFCKSTSAHGFYKLVRSDNPYMRLVWTLIILGAASGFTVHLISLIRRYLELPVNTETKVMSTRFVFPDITVCSTNSFSRLRMAANPLVPSLNITFASLLNMTKGFWSHGLNQSINSRDINRDSINSLKSFLHEVNVTRQRQELIVHCHYRGIACSFLNFTEYTDPVYLSCHTFKPNQRHLVKGGEKDGGLTITLYAGDSMNFLTDEEALSFFKGIRVAVHAPDTRPNLKSEGFYAQIGFNTLAQLGYTEVKVLNKLSRKCMDFVPQVQFLGNNDKDSLVVHNFSYTLDDCHITEYQEYLRKYCNCISESLPVPASMASDAGNLCHRIGDNILLAHKRKSDSQLSDTDFRTNASSTLQAGNSTFYKRTCHDESIDLIHERTAESVNCPFPCSTVQYNLRVTRASWPDEQAIVRTALRRAIKNTYKIASSHFYDVRVLNSLLDNFNNLSLNQEFLKLDVYAQSKMGNIVEETWAYPARNLFSDLGGILGLWLGISIITLFEFFELVFCYTASVLAKRSTDKEATRLNRWQIYSDSVNKRQQSQLTEVNLTEEETSRQIRLLDSYV